MNYYLYGAREISLSVLIYQRELLEQKINHFKELIDTINYCINNMKGGVVLDMASMFKGFKMEEEWQEALKDQNEHLEKEYAIELTNQTINVESMNAAAMELIF